MFFKRHKPQPIGLDFGQDSIKMLQLTESGGRVALVAAGQALLNDEARTQPELRMPAALAAIKQLFAEHPFQGKRITTCVPRDLVHLKNIRLPVMPAEELDAAIAFEAANVFNFDLQQARLRYIVAGEVRQGQETRLEVILLAAKNAEVDGFVELLDSAGCTIDSLDFEPCAIHRSTLAPQMSQAPGAMTMLLDVGLRRSQVVMGRGAQLCFFKPIDIGARRLQAAVAKKLSISEREARTLRQRLTDTSDASELGNDSVRQMADDATRSTIEELAREVALCLRYYSVTFRGQRPTALRLVGGEANDAQLRSILADTLPIPIAASTPLEAIDNASGLQAAGGGTWALALGTALRRFDTKQAPRDFPKIVEQATSGETRPLDVTALAEVANA